MGHVYDDIEEVCLAVDSTDNFMDGSIIFTNGKFSKILFNEGYVDAKYVQGPRLWRPYKYSGMSDDQFAALMKRWTNAMNHKRIVLSFKFYNKDHLGNIREVVSKTDSIEQVNEYYPFGTPIHDLSNNPELQSFKYNGKEFDIMHGLNTLDYGARQYNPVLPVWDRVDPLAEKNYGVSPYVYCNNDPVNKIDPNGRTDYYLYSDGIIRHSKFDDSTVDRLFVKGTDNYITVNSGILEQLLHKKKGHDGQYDNHKAIIKNSNDAFKLFKFVADNSDVEWSLKGFSNHNMDSYQLSTSNNQNSVKVVLTSDEISTLKFDLHSHPRSNGKENASGYDSGSNRNGVYYSNYYEGDRSGLISILGKYQHLKGDVNMPQFYIYNARTRNLFQYDWDNASYNKKNIIYYTQFGGIIK